MMSELEWTIRDTEEARVCYEAKGTLVGPVVLMTAPSQILNSVIDPV